MLDLPLLLQQCRDSFNSTVYNTVTTYDSKYNNDEINLKSHRRVYNNVECTIRSQNLGQFYKNISPNLFDTESSGGRDPHRTSKFHTLLDRWNLCRWLQKYAPCLCSLISGVEEDGRRQYWKYLVKSSWERDSIEFGSWSDNQY